MKIKLQDLKKIISEVSEELSPDDYENAKAAEYALDQLHYHFREAGPADLDAFQRVMKILWGLQE